MRALVTDERPGDAAAIRDLIGRAFDGMLHSDGNEPDIVDALRASGDLTLSLVAVQDGRVVGHLAGSPATVGGAAGWTGIGPLAVAPDLQRAGIGSALMHAALHRLRQEGARGVVLLGDPHYYSRFGFAPATGCTWRGFGPPALQVLPLASPAPTGALRYAPAFEENA